MERHFHKDLAALKDDLLRMGALGQRMVQTAVKGLTDRDGALFAEVRQHEAQMNSLHMSLDERCFTLIALQQPTAGDLRFLLAAMKSITDLERVGDQSINVVKSGEVLLKEAPLKPLLDLPRMADLTQRMVHDSLRAFVDSDVELARSVLVTDDEVDALRDQVFRELLTYMLGDPASITRALHLILISRSLERIADHATNIAEDVIFVARGADVRHGAVDQLDPETPAADSAGG
jgi:phosphate transport system protein